jgi:hypothetical protein
VTDIVPAQQHAALFLAATDQQITAPTIPGAPAPLPPTGGRLWRIAARIVPGLVTTTAFSLAMAWHEQLPAGSAAPLWTMGSLAAAAAGGGMIAATARHGDSGTMSAALAGAAALAATGVAAWTPNWPLAALMWLTGTAATYVACAIHWRRDRRDERRHEQAVEMAHVAGYHQWRDTATRGAAAVQVAHELHQAEVAKVQVIVAASDARTRDALLARDQRDLMPGQELDVAALLRAAGHEPTPTQRAELVAAKSLDAADLDDALDIEAMWLATAEAPREPSAAERSRRR